MVPKRRILLVLIGLAVCGVLAYLYLHLSHHQTLVGVHPKHGPRLRLPYQQHHLSNKRKNAGPRSHPNQNGPDGYEEGEQYGGPVQGPRDRVLYDEREDQRRELEGPGYADPQSRNDEPWDRQAQDPRDHFQQPRVVPRQRRQAEQDDPYAAADHRQQNYQQQRANQWQQEQYGQDQGNFNQRPDRLAHHNDLNMLRRDRGRARSNDAFRQQHQRPLRDNFEAEDQYAARQRLIQHGAFEEQLDEYGEREGLQNPRVQDQYGEGVADRRRPSHRRRQRTPVREYNPDGAEMPEDIEYPRHQFQDQDNQNRPPPDLSLQELMLPAFRDQENQKLIKSFAGYNQGQNSRSAALEPNEFDPAHRGSRQRSAAVNMDRLQDGGQAEPDQYGDDPRRRSRKAWLEERRRGRLAQRQSRFEQVQDLEEDPAEAQEPVPADKPLYRRDRVRAPDRDQQVPNQDLGVLLGADAENVPSPKLRPLAGEEDDDDQQIVNENVQKAAEELEVLESQLDREQREQQEHDLLAEQNDVPGVDADANQKQLQVLLEQQELADKNAGHPDKSPPGANSQFLQPPPKHEGQYENPQPPRAGELEQSPRLHHERQQDLHNRVIEHAQEASKRSLKFFVYEPEFDAYGTLSIWYDELMKVLAHHPARTSHPEEATVFFLGVDVACPSNWPNYQRDPPNINFVKGNFMTCEEGRLERMHEYLERAPYLKDGNLHIVFDFYGWTPPNKYYHSNPNVVFAAVSHELGGGYRRNIDIAWPVMPILSSLKQEHVDCSHPPKYLVTFKGTMDSPVRGNLATLNDPDHGVVIKLTEFKPNVLADTARDAEVAREYADLMTNTEFGLVPRGDNLYSFRFLEVLSTGSIPVIFSDRWALPFHEILDYRSFSLQIPEDEWGTLLARIEAISPEQRCQMRQEGLRLYNKHFATIQGQVDTLFSIIAQRKALEFHNPQ